MLVWPGLEPETSNPNSCVQLLSKICLVHLIKKGLCLSCNKGNGGNKVLCCISKKCGNWNSLILFLLCKPNKNICVICKNAHKEKLFITERMEERTFYFWSFRYIVIHQLYRQNQGFGSVTFYLANPDHVDTDPTENVIILNILKCEIHQ